MNFNFNAWMKNGFLMAALAFPYEVGAAESIKIPLKDATGKQIGNAQLTELKKGVKVEIDVKGLKPGEHAFHFHEKGVCSAPSFKSAGEHFTAEGKKHGFDVAQGPHSGDMPNLIVNKDGTAHSEVINTQVTLTEGPSALLKQGGTSIVIHSGADDYESQPSGASGDRVACGEISSSKMTG
jgi:Cu-Zn family superoxide dismutase